jgi:formylglycine-generating enzyme required for sulfatase activity
VSEWVFDVYTPDGYRPTGTLVKSPFVVPTGLYPRVVRGGSWFDDPEMLRSAARADSQNHLAIEEHRVGVVCEVSL